MYTTLYSQKQISKQRLLILFYFNRQQVQVHVLLGAIIHATISLHFGLSLLLFTRLLRAMLHYTFLPKRNSMIHVFTNMQVVKTLSIMFIHLCNTTKPNNHKVYCNTFSANPWQHLPPSFSLHVVQTFKRAMKRRLKGVGMRLTTTTNT